MIDKFNTSLSDSQATSVTPIIPEKFDIEEYSDYEQQKLETCEKFWKLNSGVLVYRRVRVKEVFAGGCADMSKSLAYQLGALKLSMQYKTDVPNFLEPWYGIGTVASAFGFEYVWEKDLAPAVRRKLASISALLELETSAVQDTKIGKHTLQMVEYFLDKTKGRLPMSYSDIQSPLNIVADMLESSQFYIDFYLEPEAIKTAFDKAADLSIAFLKLQANIIGKSLAKPGHGFASCRRFDGIGMSDDIITMLPSDLYKEIAIPSFAKSGAAFGDPAFHSCGNWSGKKDDIIAIQGLRMADGAFSLATDPNANPTDGFSDTFTNTGVVLNARIVGDIEVVETKVKELWKPGMKLVVVTYCESPEEQEQVYNRIHEICK